MALHVGGRRVLVRLPPMLPVRMKAQVKKRITQQLARLAWETKLKQRLQRFSGVEAHGGVYVQWQLRNACNAENVDVRGTFNSMNQLLQRHDQQCNDKQCETRACVKEDLRDVVEDCQKDHWQLHDDSTWLGVGVKLQNEVDWDA